MGVGVVMGADNADVGVGVEFEGLEDVGGLGEGKREGEGRRGEGEGQRGKKGEGRRRGAEGQEGRGEKGRGGDAAGWFGSECYY